MSPSHPDQKPAGSAWAPAFLTVALGIAAVLVTVHYVRSEKFFYFWDNFAYNRASLESLAALQQPGTSWLHHLRLSMQSGFSQLFTVVTAPMMAWLGESRPVFIGSIVGFYLLPCAALGTLIVNQIVPLRRWQWPLAFLACGSLPVFWRVSLTGYPDIGGITVALAALLLIARDTEYRKWTTAISVGVILAVTFLFRRHLVYCIVALMAATTVVALARCFRPGEPGRWRRVLGTILRLALTTVITVGIIWLMAPSYFQELINTNFRELYLPFQVSIPEAWRQHRNYIGAFYGCLGLIGLVWGLWHPGAKKWVCALLLLHVAFSLFIWVFYLRYLSVQYNLHFAVVIAIGLGLLTALLHRQTGRLVAPVALAVILAVLWLDRLCCVNFVPAALESILPARVEPLRNPDYDEIKRLIDFLRASATPPRNNILVASSNGTLNSDMLTVGEGNLYGRNHRQLVVMNGSHADTVQPYSLRDMIAADWIVVASPFQHHLRVEDQGVVLSICNALLKPTAFAADFQPVKTRFALAGNVTLTLYQRIAPTPYLTQVQTARDMFDTVGIADAWSGPFMTGEAATGAEYYDARLIVPSAAGRFRADLTQVRLREGQPALTLFVRTTETGTRHLRGEIRGPGLEIKAEIFPDETPGKSSWSTTQAAANGAEVDVAYPSAKNGILAITLVPREKPPLGTPLGLQIENLRKSEN